MVSAEPRRSGTLVRLQGRIVEAQEGGAVALTAELTALYFNGPGGNKAPD